MKKIWFFLILILLTAFILRFWQLGKVPISMSDDEVRLTYNAYSIWNTHKDINGNSFPLSFVVDGYSFNPVPIYLSSIFVGVLGLDMFSSRLPFALAGVLTVILLFLIAKKLLGNKIIALLSSFALTFSVWHIQLSRFAYEGGFALFFYVFGTYIFLNSKKNNLFRTLFSMILFLLAFYSYSGTKLILLPIVAVLVWYKFRDLNYKQLGMALIFVFLAFSSFVFLDKTQKAGQYGSYPFFFQNSSKASEAVELERRASSEPEILKRLYHNKLTYWSKIFFDHYSYAFSSQYLFSSQEASGILSIWFRGQMYYVEGFLLIAGALYLFLKKRKELLLITLFLFIAPIPSGLGSEPITYTIRSSFMLPWIMILVGAGIYSIYYFIKNKKIRLCVYGLLILTYAYFIVGYLGQYYFEWSKYGAKYYSKSNQDLALFLGDEKKKGTEYAVEGAGSMEFLHYAYYNKLSPLIVQKLYKEKEIKVNNISYREKCISNFDVKTETGIEQKNLSIILPPYCFKLLNKSSGLNPTRIIKSLEGENEWYVF